MKKLSIILSLLLAASQSSLSALDFSRAAVVYDLTLTQDGDNYTVGYSCSADVPGVVVTLTNTTNPSDVRQYEITNVAAGANSYVIDASTLPEGAVYTWKVTANHSDLADPALAFSQTRSVNNTSGSVTRGGIVTFNDPSRPTFGMIVTASAFNQGFDIYTPDLSLVGTYHSGFSEFSTASNYSPYRGDAWGDKAIFTDWSNSGCGLWIVDPLNPSTTPTNLIEGDRDSHGCITYNDELIGGSGSAVQVVGSGEQTKIYQFAQFYEEGANVDKIVRYDIGNATSITSAPEVVVSQATISSALSSGFDCDLIVVDEGYFVSHDLGSTAQSASLPGFVFFDNTGTLRYSSNSISGLNPNMPSYGMALSADKSLFVCSDLNNHILFFDVEWTAGVPSMTYSRRITTENSVTYGGYHSAMKFDAVGNLVVYHRGKGLKVYGMPRTGSSFTMEASPTLTIESTFVTYPDETPIAYAYGLSAVKDEDDFLFTFQSNADAPSGELVFNRCDGVGEPISIPIPSVTMGTNQVRVPQSTLRIKKDYDWSVAITTPARDTAGLITKTTRTAGYSSYSDVGIRGGVVAITDPYQPSFGKTITSSGHAEGIDIYSPEGLWTGTTYQAGASPQSSASGFSLWRGCQWDGKVVFIDWSEPGSGYWVFDPENPTAALTDMLAGTVNSSTGVHTYNSEAIGGGATGISILPDGEDWEFFIYSEDYPVSATNNLVRYDVVNGQTQITTPPDQVFNEDLRTMFYDAAAVNRYNVEVIATSAGLFLSRGSTVGSNTEARPGFIFIDHYGTVKFNSYTDLPGASSKTLGPGMALSLDKRTFAISNHANGIEIYSIHWSDANVPEFTYQYTISTPTQNDGEHTQMNFDYAGNLVVFGRGVGYEYFRLKNAAPVTVVTPAASGSICQTEFNNGPYTFIDLKPYELYDDESDVEITYERNFQSTNWQTLYVPFNLAYAEWSPYADVAALYNVHLQSDGTVALEFETLKAGDEVVPNKPYIIKAKTEGEVSFHATNKSLKARPASNGWVDCYSTTQHHMLVGCYEEDVVADNASRPIYELRNNRFRRATGDQTILPFRSYLYVELRNRTSAPAMRATASSTQLPNMVYLMIDGKPIDDSTTGVENISVAPDETDDTPCEYYDLRGVRQTNPVPGQILINRKGEKIVVR